MRQILITITLLICCFVMLAQTPKKPAKPKEKPPTQKEMDDMMKEMDNILKNMTPEEKRMYDSMGINIPNMKNMPHVTDKQLAEAWDEENRIVPKKDSERMAAASKISLTETSLAAFINTTHNYILTRLTNETKSTGEKIYAALSAKTTNANALGNNAAAFWIMGKPEIALYLAGKSCITDPSNSNNISNYAAMISMCGAEQLAIPLLQYLRSKFPRNSTVLNNLGQAWYGLGDITKAEKYFDSTIRLYAWHPQATFTKSFIEESKGKTEQAVQLVKKSILHSYSEEKEERLRKLKYELKPEDIRFHFKPDPDPMALGIFRHPAFPVTAEEEVGFQKDWRTFRDDINTKANQITRRLKEAQEVMANKQQNMINYNLAISKQSMAAGKPTGRYVGLPLYWRKGTLKLKALDKAGGINSLVAIAQKEMAAFHSKMIPKKMEYEKEIARLREEDLEQTGEGKPNLDYCMKYKAVVDKYLKACNPEYEKLCDQFLEHYRRKLSEEIFWYQYVQLPEQFEVTKLSFQLAWLGVLKDLKYFETYFFENRPLCIKKDEKRKVSGRLAEFNDIHCKVSDTMELYVGQMISNCSRFITKFDVKFLQFEMTQDNNKAGLGESFLGCTIKVGMEESISKFDLEPVRIEAKAGIGFEFEFDRTGLKDLVFISEIKGGLGTNQVEVGEKSSGLEQSIGGNDAIPNSVEIGVKGKISIISGKTTLEGSGILQKK